VAVANSAEADYDPGQDGFRRYYTWNVRVDPGEYDSRDGTPGGTGVIRGAPPSPRRFARVNPPD
jgi:hypothetical protein